MVIKKSVIHIDFIFFLALVNTYVNNDENEFEFGKINDAAHRHEAIIEGKNVIHQILDSDGKVKRTQLAHDIRKTLLQRCFNVHTTSFYRCVQAGKENDMSCFITHCVIKNFRSKISGKVILFL